jgi:hypothetical protein
LRNFAKTPKASADTLPTGERHRHLVPHPSSVCTRSATSHRLARAREINAVKFRPDPIPPKRLDRPGFALHFPIQRHIRSAPGL